MFFVLEIASSHFEDSNLYFLKNKFLFLLWGKLRLVSFFPLGFCGEDESVFFHCFFQFDYLHNFGPRFKTLADMYGRDSDSEEEEDEEDEGGVDNRGFPGQHHQQQHPYQMHIGASASPYGGGGGVQTGPPPSESWC